MSRLAAIALITSVSLAPHSAQAMFGMELGPMLQLVAGQVKEIEQLTRQVGLAKDQRDILIQLNSGIDQTVSQIQALQSILDRAQGLQPNAIRSIADLNEFLSRMKDAKRSVEELMSVRLQAAELVVHQSAIQSETAYLMGQEMVGTGIGLAQESRTASPGRAQQITAASTSAQMLAQGVQLQTLAQISQTQAMQLELQRSQIQQLHDERKASQTFFEMQLVQASSGKPKRKRP